MIMKFRRLIMLQLISAIVILTGCGTAVDTFNPIQSHELSNAVLEREEEQEELTSQVAIDTIGIADSSLLDNIDTTDSLFEKGYYDYQGTISDNMEIQMSVYPLDKDIVGSYFYNSQRKEIILKGKAGTNDIVLYEYDESGKNTGIFKGTMVTVDKIEGTWTSADNKASYPFTLSLSHNLPGTEYGKRYAVATGIESDQAAENFVSKIQGYIINDNKEQLAEEVQYPISVKINDKDIKIQSEADFIKNYDEIFYPDYKQLISNAFTKYMFANWKGIMFGAGSNNIWITEITPANGSSKLMITAINN